MIFDFLEYRPYLESRLGKKGSRTGLRKRLSEAIGVHTSFVSQVLLDKADLSLEQAEQANEFLEHNEVESEYFLLLVLKDRAGSVKLRKRFDQKIYKMREERLNVKKRISPEGEIKQEDRLKFYSNYYYAAIHVLVSIPSFQNIDAIVAALKVQRGQVIEMMDFLMGIGLVIKRGDKFLPGPQHVHLGNDSELVLSHHKNWRMHSLDSLKFLNKDDLHYSACISLSKKDAFKVRDAILENLQKNVKTITTSKEEVAYVYNIDFYSLL